MSSRPRRSSSGKLVCLAAVLILVHCAPSPDIAVRVDSPRERQVFQNDDGEGADVSVAGSVVGAVGEIEIRIILDDEAVTPWVPVSLEVDSSADARFAATLRLPSGGWYELQWRVTPDGPPQTAIHRVGVGEVFVVAGQSNAANWGEPSAKSVSNDLVSTVSERGWEVARDPMPGVQDDSEDGSPWPRFGDLLQRSLDLPVAVVSVACGNSSILDWQPPGAPRDNGTGESLFPALRDRILEIGPVRAILWHQGERDAHDGMSKDEYVASFQSMQQGLREDTGADTTWIVARASFLPENDAASMSEIREAQHRLWTDGHALPGPDTDELRGDLRAADGAHFSRHGLELHAQGWHEAVRKLLSR